MTNLLIIGYSNVARRRVLPAFEQLAGVGQVDLASRTGVDRDSLRSSVSGEVYSDYESALEASAAELVYVSLVNSEHARWARAAIECGRHVVVDKPAFLSLRAADECADLAGKKGVLLAEATVYAYHPQVEIMRRAFAEVGSAPSRITASFSFPPLDAGNFRYRRDLGGGALWDLGPYAASIGRVFYGDEPDAVACSILSHGGPDGVETAFSMLCAYRGGRSVVGHFGFDTAYRNHLALLGADLGVEIDRVFTAPGDEPNEVRISGVGGDRSVQAPAANAFAGFFDCVVRSIAARNWSPLTADLLADARTLARLRSAAGIE